MSTFNSLDYSRFDQLGDSDEESVHDQPDTAFIEQMVNKVYYDREGSGSESTSQPGGWHPLNQIKIHPRDHSAPAWVYSDPDTWEAPPDPGNSTC